MPRRMLMLWLMAMALSIAWIVWPSQLETKEGALASVASIQGSVHIRPAGSFSWGSARVGSHLLALDAIATGTKSRARLRLENGTTIVLPEDTQIKIQAQNSIPGMTISLIKGGLEVQAEEILPADKKSAKVETKRQATAKPIVIQTSHYNVDLSRLEGQFRLQAHAGAQATKPETVRLQNTKGAISLAQLDAPQAPTVSELLDGFKMESPRSPGGEYEIPVLDPIPEPMAAPPSINVPVKKLQPVKVPELAPVDVTPSPETLPLLADDDEVEEELIPPRLKDSQLSFWSVEPIAESTEIPLTLPLGPPKAVFDGNRWQSLLRISVQGSKKFVVIKREPGPFGLFFSLRELQDILPSRNLEAVTLIVETGLMRRDDAEKDLRTADRRTTVSLHSLQNLQGVTLQLDSWKFVEPTDQWIRTTPLRKSEVILHLLGPRLLLELEGYVRGAGEFAVQPLQASHRSAPIHFVRGETIIACADNLEQNMLKSLIKRLKPDLVYRGDFAAFLGGKGSFDLNKEAHRERDLYYVRRNQALKLDRNLFKTHSAARAFIRNFNPYFLGAPVEVLYNKD